MGNLFTCLDISLLLIIFPHSSLHCKLVPVNNINVYEKISASCPKNNRTTLVIHLLRGQLTAYLITLDSFNRGNHYIIYIGHLSMPLAIFQGLGPLAIHGTFEYYFHHQILFSTTTVLV